MEMMWTFPGSEWDCCHVPLWSGPGEVPAALSRRRQEDRRLQEAEEEETEGGGAAVQAQGAAGEQGAQGRVSAARYEQQDQDIS